MVFVQCFNAMPLNGEYSEAYVDCLITYAVTPSSILFLISVSVLVKNINQSSISFMNVQYVMQMLSMNAFLLLDALIVL